MSRQSGSPKVIGIYTIRKDDKFYIGQSTDILYRFLQHKRDLKGKHHCNSKLQRSCDKHGIDKFSFEIIEGCLESELDQKEQYWCDTLDVIKSGYNIAMDIVSPMRGRKHSEETKQRMSEIQLLRFKTNPPGPVSDETREKRRQSMLKRYAETPVTQETRDKVAASKRGKKRPPMSEEQKAKISASCTGKKQTIETTEKMSRNKMGISFNQCSANKKLSFEIAENIRIDFKSGIPRKEICLKYAISKSSVDKILRNATYTTNSNLLHDGLSVSWTDLKSKYSVSKVSDLPQEALDLIKSILENKC